jgi:hypothetical protein
MTAHLMVARKQRERERGRVWKNVYNFQRLTLSDLFPPSQPYLIIVDSAMNKHIKGFFH